MNKDDVAIVIHIFMMAITLLVVLPISILMFYTIVNGDLPMWLKWAILK